MLPAVRQWRWFALAALLAGCVLNPQPDLPSMGSSAAPGAGGSNDSAINSGIGGVSAGGRSSVAGASTSDAAGAATAATAGSVGVGAAGETSEGGAGDEGGEFGASAGAGTEPVLGAGGER